ncbi:triphosphoribosyl-dephospho-CoA synthase [Rhodoligotrophos defluvii]|uniref:triphosphoribosyl-dephospho-CoA synthase n=1 Tax=Rhodoligotrophos defluvii TaxID=2561934 RepID=UPI0010C9649F|nr:triphosphoribosyl-dephospho-CoA synthase [Rhodoligotrophos defluvii]
MRPTPSAIASAFVAACREELAAPKPGNVHVFAAGHGMTVDQFLTSADAAATALATSGASVGARILDAISATKVAVGCNTNLGIILLCAPLAAAAERGAGLRSALAEVLEELTVEDAELAFEAIVLADPAGLGEADAHDVRAPADCTLLEAMASAAARDRIAQAYADEFEEVFGPGLATLEEARARALCRWWPATAVYLAHMAAAPDSHILRKHGPDVAGQVRSQARAVLSEMLDLAEPEAALDRLLALDRSLKDRGLNPGTCADLTVATLFADRLAALLKNAPGSG